MDELHLSVAPEGLSLRIGPTSLLVHAPPEPPGPTLLQANRALAALAAGRTPVGVGLPGGARLRLDRLDADEVAATVTSGDGVLLLVSARVPLAPLVASVAEALAELGADEGPATLVVPEGALPLALHPEPGGLHLRLGGVEAHLGTDPDPLAEALVGGVEQVLHMRDWPTGRILIPLTPMRQLALYLGEELSAGLVDEAARLLGPRQALTVPQLIRAVLTCLPSSPRGRAARRTLQALMSWDQALREPPLPPRPAPTGWRRPLAEAPAPLDPLPVDRLRHLAWRRRWRYEAPGLVRVRSTGPRLWVHGHGLVALDAASGRLCWRRPELALLPGGDAGFAVDAEGALHRLEARGRTRWRLPHEGEGPFRAAWRGRIELALADTLFGLRDGHPVWRYDSAFGAIHRVEQHTSLVWLTAEDGRLHGLRRADGTRQFTTPILGEVDAGPVITPAGLLVTSVREPAGHGLLALYDSLQGRLRWRITTEGPPLGPPVRLGDTVLLTHGRPEALTVECVGLSDGDLRWRHRHLPLRGQPRILPTATVILKGRDGSALALDAATGRVRWRLEGEDDDAHLLHNPHPVLCRGVLLIPGATVRAVDPHTGRLIRRLDCGELVPAWLHAGAEGDLVIAEDEAVVHYALGGHLAVVPRWSEA